MRTNVYDGTHVQFGEYAGFTNPTLQAHLKIHQKERLHKCAFCSRRFLSMVTLDSHMSRHTGEKRFMCDICPICLFRIVQHYEKHCEGHSTNPVSIKCHLCEMKFLYQRTLKIHLLKVHDRPKENEFFACVFCDQ